jgi:hypothetical protein
MKATLIFLIIFLFASCSNEPKQEKAKLNIKQTAEVMTELRLANAAYNLYHNQMAEKDRAWLPYQSEIFQPLKVQPEDFSSSLKIHSQYPDSILLMDSLILEKLKIKSRKEIEPSIDTHHPIKKYKRQIHRQGGE